MIALTKIMGFCSKEEGEREREGCSCDLECTTASLAAILVIELFVTMPFTFTRMFLTIYKNGETLD